MPTISEALAAARAQQQAGAYAAAAEICRRVADVEPAAHEAWHLLGCVLWQQGKPAEALAPLRQAAALAPGSAAIHNNLGLALLDVGEHAAAEEAFRRAVERNPQLASARYNLGLSLAVQERPAAAIEAYRAAIAVQPVFAEAYNNLAQLLWKSDDQAAAVECYATALRQRPKYTEAWTNLGHLLRSLGRQRQALEAFVSATRVDPTYAEAHYGLGATLSELGRVDAAIDCFREAIRLSPAHDEAHNALGMAMLEKCRYGEAEAALAEASALNPSSAPAISNLGIVRRDLGDIEGALDCYRRALELQPDLAAAQSNYLLSLQSRPGVTLAELDAAHREWDDRHAAALRADWRPHPLQRSPERPLRIGFVSPDFTHHPVAAFFAPLLEALPPDECFRVCYHLRPRQDAMTQRLEAAADLWRQAAHLADDALAAAIREDKIDILVDLAGHTGFGRPTVFARKPAPIQVLYLGYECTTGMAAMDYIVADDCQTPAGVDEYYRERLLRLPGPYVAFEPPAEAPPLSPPPRAAGGRPTLGSFNNLSKLNAAVVRCWAEILRQSDARLVLKFKSLSDAAARERLAGLFEAAGIARERIELVGATPLAEHLRWYNRIDLALDPFPYGGTTTSCQALWMGVPVVTLPGETFASRDTLGQLRQVGLEDFAVGDEEAYVRRAVAALADVDRLAQLRRELRGRMAAAALCDPRRLARQFMDALRTAWRQWCML